jgi:adenylosuccinate lyase
MPEPYERLKELTRGTTVTAEEVRAFIEGLGLPAEAERSLLELDPWSYLGLAGRLAESGRKWIDDEEPRHGEGGR